MLSRSAAGSTGRANLERSPSRYLICGPMCALDFSFSLQMNSHEAPSVGRHRPRLRVVGRIGDGELDLQLTEAGASKAFDDRELVAGRETAMVEPLLPVESPGLDDKRVAPDRRRGSGSTSCWACRSRTGRLCRRSSWAQAPTGSASHPVRAAHHPSAGSCAETGIAKSSRPATAQAVPFVQISLLHRPVSICMVPRIFCDWYRVSSDLISSHVHDVADCADLSDNPLDPLAMGNE
jgi:hypothetical protein